jgi:hypothetical protein
VPRPGHAEQAALSLTWGKSTGPRTAEGLARCRRTRWLHGRRSQEARLEGQASADRNEAELWEEHGRAGVAAGFLVRVTRPRGFVRMKLWRP